MHSILVAGRYGMRIPGVWFKLGIGLERLGFRGEEPICLEKIGKNAGK